MLVIGNKLKYAGAVCAALLPEHDNTANIIIPKNKNLKFFILLFLIYTIKIFVKKPRKDKHPKLITLLFNFI